MKKSIAENAEAEFKIGQAVRCIHENKTGVVEYNKNGWVGVRTIIGCSGKDQKLSSNLIPQQPSNLMHI